MVNAKKKLIPRGSLYKHTKTGGWYLRVRWPGDVEYSSVPLRPPGEDRATKLKGIAVQLAKRVIEKKLGSEAPIEMELVDLLEEFRRENTLSAKPEQSQRSKTRVSRFLLAANIEDPEKITRRAIRSYLIDLGQTVAPKTVKEYKSAISLFCEFLIERELLMFNPARAVRLRKVPPLPPVLMPTKSVEAVLEGIAESEYDFKYDMIIAVRIAAKCGLRLSEILQLRRRAILNQGEGNYAVLVGEKDPTKSGQWRIVPLSADLHDAILANRPKAKPGDSIFHCIPKSGQWQRRLKLFSEGLEGFLTRKGTGSLWHALRAYCATQKAKTYPVYRLMYEMGWSDSKVAQRYVTLAQAAGVIG
ncbi:MAG: site-specific integrase [Phycisphaerales bacterium]|jgi:integrase|nr:site-specific integrase [Phycisphaerales bacterium]